MGPPQGAGPRGAKPHGRFGARSQAVAASDVAGDRHDPRRGSVDVTRDIGAVVIVDEAGNLAGIFTERDLLTKAVGPEKAQLPVSAFMTPRPETVRESDSLAYVLHKMDGGGYRHLPVVKNGRPVGMISVRDMLHHITRLCNRLRV